MTATTDELHAASVEADTWPTVRFRCPPTWKRELQAAAELHGISLSALIRLQIGKLVRERHAS